MLQWSETHRAYRIMLWLGPFGITAATYTLPQPHPHAPCKASGLNNLQNRNVLLGMQAQFVTVTHVKSYFTMQIKAALEQQNGSAPSDEEVFYELLSKAVVDKDAIRSAMAAAKKAADDKAAAEAAAAAAAEQADATGADAPAAE